jgi:CRISP-associated protein Cas1
MATLYLTKQNTILRKTGKRLIYCTKPPGASTKPGVRQTEILLDLPCEDIDHVMIFGNVQLTTQAMQQLLRNGIETALFSIHGELLGQITPPAAKNILLRKAQYDKYDDDAFRLNFSRKLVKQKIEYSVRLLREFRHNHPDAFSEDKLESIIETSEKAIEAQSLEQLLGYEGAASALYFKLLGQLPPPEFRFLHRTRRPPKDAANAVLSFGYTIVTSELRAILDGVGFDPYLGFYHEIDYGRPSLSLDMVELFRHAFVDRLMLRLFNLGMLGAEDFETVAHGGVYLSNSGKRTFFEQYEELAGSYRGEADLKAKTGFREDFRKQVNILMKAVADNADFYYVCPDAPQEENI